MMDHPLFRPFRELTNPKGFRGLPVPERLLLKCEVTQDAFTEGDIITGTFERIRLRKLIARVLPKKWITSEQAEYLEQILSGEIQIPPLE